MSDHYFTEKPSTAQDRKLLSVLLRGFDLRIVTDAGVFSKQTIDFGSRLLIEQMEIRENDFVLDVGCGYGIIGLVAAHLAPRGEAVLVDLNERAVYLARENASLNRLQNVRVEQSDLFSNLKQQQFDKILTNPPIRAGKQVVHRILEESLAWLRPGGELWVVIQKKQGAPSAIKKMEEVYSIVEVVKKEKGYHIIRAQKHLTP